MPPCTICLQALFKFLDHLHSTERIFALYSSYQLLDDMVDRARDSDPMAIERIPDLLQFTVAHVTSFEGCIQRCLDIPVSNVAPTLSS